MKTHLLARHGFACLAFVVMATTSSHAATNFIYDAYQQAPSTLPQNPPWTEVSAFVNGTDSRTASGRLLTLVDGSAVNDPGYYYQRVLGVSDIGTNSEYEARARLRVTSYGDLGGLSRALFSVAIEDGSRFLGFGATLTNGQARFFLLDNTAGPGYGFYNAPLTGDDFFNVSVRKVGTTGTSLDQIQLYVDGVLAMTQNYGNMPVLFGSPNGTRDVYWGTASSPAFGTVELTGVSFGIDQFAPALIPEPSTIALCAATALLVFRRMRKQKE